MKVLGFIIVQLLLSDAHYIGYSGRTETLHKFITKQKVNRQFAEEERIDKCTTNVLLKSADHFGYIFVFFHDNGVHGNLIRNVQSSFTYSFFTNSNIQITLPRASFHHVVMFNDKFFVKDVLNMTRPTADTKFLVLLKNSENVLDILEEFWKNRVTNVLISYMAGEAVQYVTYFPYSMSHCGRVGVPVTMAKCHTLSGVLDVEKNLFPDGLINLYNCPINVTFDENIPSAYYTTSNKPIGWEVELVKEIVHLMNGTPHYRILKFRKKYKKSRGYKHLVKDAEIGGGMVIALPGLVKTDFCLYGQSLCTTWIIPRKHDTKNSLIRMYEIFPLEVWLMILLTFSLVALVAKITSEKSFSTILFKLLPFLLGNTIPIKKHYPILGMFWVWFCITMDTIYQKEYQSAFLVPHPPRQMNNSLEILYSNLKIVIISEAFTDYIPYFMRQYKVNDERVKVKGGATYEDWTKFMAIKKDSAILGFREIVQYQLGRTDLASKVHIYPYCVMRYSLAFILKKNSHLTKSLLRYSQRLNENGYTNYLMKKYLPGESEFKYQSKLNMFLKNQTYGGNSINMKKMSAIFLGLLVCLSLASLAFTIELLSVFQWNKIIILLHSLTTERK